MTTKKEAIITIRWFDGYIETFEAKNYRFGKDLLRLVLEKSNWNELINELIEELE